MYDFLVRLESDIMRHFRPLFLAAASGVAPWLILHTADADFILPEEIVFISNGEDTADALIDDLYDANGDVDINFDSIRIFKVEQDNDGNLASFLFKPLDG